MRLRVVLAAFLFVPAGSVAAMPDQGLLFLQSLDQRIADISWKIAAANVALCSQTTGAIGISLHNSAQYSPTYRQAANDTFGFGDGLPGISALAKGSPGDLAGLRTGDQITSINGEALTAVVPASRAKEDYAPISAVMARLERLPADTPVRLGVRRGAASLNLVARPKTVCRSRVEVVPSGEINANSDGTVVQIYGKLVLWTKTDDELAIVIAHEMAHNILGHNRRIEQERITTGLLASLGIDGSRHREMEREADRYGLYLAARAGYDYRIAADLWRRLSQTAGLASLWATTHPTARDRARFNRVVITDIEREINAGRDPVPGGELYPQR